MNKNDLKNDFQDFLNSSPVRPPKELSEKILSRVRKELDPPHAIVFLKLVSIQAIVGILTLLFCPQFEVSLTNNHKLFHFFHYTFGYYGCMAICGALFVGSGALFASYILSLGEINKIRNSRFLYYFAITGIACSTFVFLGAKIYFDVISIWIIGAIIGGITMLEVNSFLRKKILYG